MTTDTATPEPIYALVSRIAAETGAVRKGDVNQQQGFNFRGIDAVTKAVYPALIRHGVVIVPDVRTVDYGHQTTRSGGNLNLCRVTVRYVFWGPAGDHLDAVVAAEAMDSGDKATSKAMSVAFRTALLQVLTLPTDDPDPDAYSYETAPANVNTTTGEVGDPVAAVTDAMNAATTLDELREIYTRHGLGSPSVPAAVRDSFQQRVDAVRGGSAPDGDADAAAAQQNAEGAS